MRTARSRRRRFPVQKMLRPKIGRRSLRSGAEGRHSSRGEQSEHQPVKEADDVGAHVVSSARVAKQAIVSGRVLRVRRIVVASEGTRRDRDPVWRSWFVLRFETQVAVTISARECDLGNAARHRSVSNLVWTSHCPAWLDVY